MIFLDKYSEINALFGELGWGIGSLGDSSKYDERFVAIADAVIALNKGNEPIAPSPNTIAFIFSKGMELKPSLADQMIALLNELKEREGFQWSVVVGHCVDDKVAKRRRGYSWWTFMKALWNNGMDDGATGLGFLIPFVIFAAIAILLWLSQDTTDMEYFFAILSLGSLSVTIFFLHGRGISDAKERALNYKE